MGKKKLDVGDIARVLPTKVCVPGPHFPMLTTVKVVKKYHKKVHQFYAYYCTALDGPEKGLTQLVITCNLEKIESPQAVN